MVLKIFFTVVLSFIASIAFLLTCTCFIASLYFPGGGGLVMLHFIITAVPILILHRMWRPATSRRAS